MSTTKGTHVTGTVNAGNLAAKGLFQVGGQPFFPALQQIVENAMDAGASGISILVQKKEGRIIIMDDGEGFSRKDATAFLSVCDSGKAGDNTKVGQHGSGRLQLLSFAEQLTVYTRSKDLRALHTFSLSKEQVINLIAKGQHRFTVKTPKRRPTWLPTWKGFGSAIVVEGINWEHVPSLRKLRAELPRYLRPSFAKRIKVNGKGLEPLQVMGEVIQEVVEVDYLPGEQEVELYIPERKRRGQTVMIGGFGPICPLQALVSSLTPEEQSMLPSELTHRDLCGSIYIPALNEFRTHASNQLDSNLYTDANQGVRAQIIRLLIEVGAKVKATFGKKDGKSKRELRQVAFATLAERMNQIFAFDPKAIRGSDTTKGSSSGNTQGSGSKGGTRSNGNHLRVNTRKIKLTPGESYLFEVIDTQNTSGRFKWSRSDIGGNVKVLSGTKKAAYVAGDECGQFTLTVSDSQDTSMCTQIIIEIVEEHIFHILPEQATIVQGGHKIFQLANLRSSEGALTWSLEDESQGIRLSPMNNGKVRVSVGREAAPGEYTLALQDEADNICTASFTVTEPPADSAFHMRIGNTYYCLTAASFSTTVASVRIGPERGRGKPRIDMMEVYFDHDLLVAQAKGKGDQYQRTIADHVMLAHVLYQMEQESETDLRQVDIRLAQLKQMSL